MWQLHFKYTSAECSQDSSTQDQDQDSEVQDQDLDLQDQDQDFNIWVLRRLKTKT